MSSLKFFKEGFIPAAGAEPAENTHERAKLIYNLVKITAIIGKRRKKPMPEKAEAMIREIKHINHTIGSRVEKYYKEVTRPEVAFTMGEREWYNDDGTVAIYHPQLDNPILMKVVTGEQPKTDEIGRTPLWAPRERRSQVNLPE